MASLLPPTARVRPVRRIKKNERDTMPKTYEHTFNDLGGQSDEPTDTQVDLGNPEQRQDATGATINPSPGNPDKGRADQFGDLGGKKAPDTDEGIDIVDGGQQQDADTDTDEDALAGG